MPIFDPCARALPKSKSDNDEYAEHRGRNAMRNSFLSIGNDLEILVAMQIDSSNFQLWQPMKSQEQEIKSSGSAWVFSGSSVVPLGFQWFLQRSGILNTAAFQGRKQTSTKPAFMFIFPFELKCWFPAAFLNFQSYPTAMRPWPQAYESNDFSSSDSGNGCEINVAMQQLRGQLSSSVIRSKVKNRSA